MRFCSSKKRCYILSVSVSFCASSSPNFQELQNVNRPIIFGPLRFSSAVFLADDADVDGTVRVESPFPDVDGTADASLELPSALTTSSSLVVTSSSPVPGGGGWQLLGRLSGMARGSWLSGVEFDDAFNPKTG